jgi:hypothetical protein
MEFLVRREPAPASPDNAPNRLKSFFLDPTGRLIRSSNISPPYFTSQKGGSCYAHAATSAYINTCARIYGLIPPIPSYDECIAIADYSHGNGGRPEESIRLLEERFQCGICSEVCTGKPSIRDLITLSIIADFTTSPAGWKNIGQGHLMDRAPGVAKGWHAVLAEAYELIEDYGEGKNSWGHANGTKERFKFRWEAFHDYKYIKVFWTLNSIRGKTQGIYQPRLERFIGELDGRPIDCAYMDEQASEFEQNFVCRLDPTRSPPLNFFGYDLDQYIQIKLNRPKTAA